MMGKPLSTTRRVLAAIAGVVVFLIVNAALFLDQCRPTEFMLNCSTSSSGQYTPFVLVTVVLLVGLALASQTARAFAAGFFGALALLAIVTTGACTATWADPYTTYRIKTAPARLARERSAKEQAIKDAWVRHMNARPMEILRGVEFAGQAFRCAHRYAEQNGGRFAVTEREIRPCDTWERWRVSPELLPGIHYRIPNAPPREPLLGLPTTPSEGDPGWRIRYDPDPKNHFTITVVPDEALAHRWPRIYMDGTGRLEVESREHAARLEISPVEDLRVLVHCLKGLPQEDERRRAQGLLGYTRRFTARIKALCPPLIDRVKELAPAEEEKTFLAVRLPVGAADAPELVAGWIVEFVQRRPNEPNDYDLVARPATAGLSYVVAMEGDIRSYRLPPQTTVDGKIVTDADRSPGR